MVKSSSITQKTATLLMHLKSTLPDISNKNVNIDKKKRSTEGKQRLPLSATNGR